MKKWTIHLIFCVTNFFVTDDISAQTGIFEPANNVYMSDVSKKIIRQIPRIDFRFKEFNDSSFMNKSKKIISAYTKYKKAPYAFPGMYFANPSLQSEEILDRLKNLQLNIEALCYYIDTASFRFDKKIPDASVNTVIPLEKIFSPFYICENEVTVKEYGEFIKYVRDSLARTLLAKAEETFSSRYGITLNDTLRLNWKTPIKWDSDDAMYQVCLNPLYFPVFDRYYNRKEVDTRKLNFIYYHHNEKNEEVKDIINVYPDTLSWVHDFLVFETAYREMKYLHRWHDNFSASDSNKIIPLTSLNTPFEPITNMYNWHPAYENFPAVGLTFKQVNAFLNWKCKELQKEIDKKRTGLEIELDLPSAIEWEIIERSKKENKEWKYLYMRKYRYFSSSQNFEPSLKYKNSEDFVLVDSSVTPDSKIDYTKLVIKKNLTEGWEDENSKEKYSLSPENKELYDMFVINIERGIGGFTICPSDKLNYKKGEPDQKLLNYIASMENKGFVSFLNGNVSEWTKERAFAQGTGLNYYPSYKWSFPYNGDFENISSLYLKMLTNYNGKEVQEYASKLEKKQKSILPNARLVQGANFYDKGDILNGANKFTFVSEDSAHCTLGFRYVIRFREKK